MNLFQNLADLLLFRKNGLQLFQYLFFVFKFFADLSDFTLFAFRFADLVLYLIEFHLNILQSLRFRSIIGKVKDPHENQTDQHEHTQLTIPG